MEKPRPTANGWKTANVRHFFVKEGDRVLFSSYSGNEVNIDGEDYLIMTEDDVLAVVD